MWPSLGDANAGEPKAGCLVDDSPSLVARDQEVGSASGDMGARLLAGVSFCFFDGMEDGSIAGTYWECKAHTYPKVLKEVDER
tara:strand:+ start:1109 stop:1357 length:249 start_codon:yes stop_codon:yes gene_type:complete